MMKHNIVRWHFARHNCSVTCASYSAIYVVTMFSGLAAFFNLPKLLIRDIGLPMILVFGGFVFFGSVLALLGLIVDYAWVERVGLILLITAVAMYAVMLLVLKNVTIALFLVSALVISLIQRYIEVRVEGGRG